MTSFTIPAIPLPPPPSAIPAAPQNAGSEQLASNTQAAGNLIDLDLTNQTTNVPQT